MHLYHSNNFWKAPWKSSCVSVSMTLSQPLSSPQLSHNDNLWDYWISKSHREQRLDFREAKELSWCPSWSNSLWQGWSCGNATDPIWRVLDSSDGISFWTPLKPQHSWLSVLWEPSACRPCQCCQKKGSSKVCGRFALSGLLGSGRASMLPLGTLSLGLWVIAVNPAFITWCFFQV